MQGLQVGCADPQRRRLRHITHLRRETVQHHREMETHEIRCNNKPGVFIFCGQEERCALPRESLHPRPQHPQRCRNKLPTHRQIHRRGCVHHHGSQTRTRFYCRMGTSQIWCRLDQPRLRKTHLISRLQVSFRYLQALFLFKNPPQNRLRMSVW